MANSIAETENLNLWRWFYTDYEYYNSLLINLIIKINIVIRQTFIIYLSCENLKIIIILCLSIISIFILSVDVHDLSPPLKKIYPIIQHQNV